MYGDLIGGGVEKFFFVVCGCESCRAMLIFAKNAGNLWKFNLRVLRGMQIFVLSMYRG